VKPAPFDYRRPETLEEALDALADGDAKVLAGGQSLVPLLSMRLAAPARLVDINRLPDLDAVAVTDEGVRIGALTRHAHLEHDRAAHSTNALLGQALACVAHPTIRNRGTTVGSLVHADPAAEMPAVLTLLGGTVEVASAARGRREIVADTFFLGPLESALEPDEMAVAATFPHPPPGAGTAWLELSRRHGDYAIVGVGAVVVPDHDGLVESAALAFCSVGGTPVLVDVTPALAGNRVTELMHGSDHDALGEVDGLVGEALDPEPDIHASAEYRRHLAQQLSRRAVGAAARQAGAGSARTSADADREHGGADGE
jgi:carbon-monoxide dehydrogenase medium subunit